MHQEVQCVVGYTPIPGRGFMCISFLFCCGYVGQFTAGCYMDSNFVHDKLNRSHDVQKTLALYRILNMYSLVGVFSIFA